MADFGAAPEKYPGLARFLDGYLHQDFRDGYGSARAAAETFLDEATVPERRRIRAETRVLRRALEGRPLAEWRDALLEIGGAWWPQSMREVERVLAILEQPASAP